MSFSFFGGGSGTAANSGGIPQGQPGADPNAGGGQQGNPAQGMGQGNPGQQGQGGGGGNPNPANNGNPVVPGITGQGNPTNPSAPESPKPIDIFKGLMDNGKQGKGPSPYTLPQELSLSKTHLTPDKIKEIVSSKMRPEYSPDTLQAWTQMQQSNPEMAGLMSSMASDVMRSTSQSMMQVMVGLLENYLPSVLANFNDSHISPQIKNQIIGSQDELPAELDNEYIREMFPRMKAQIAENNKELSPSGVHSQAIALAKQMYEAFGGKPLEQRTDPRKQSQPNDFLADVLGFKSQ